MKPSTLLPIVVISLGIGAAALYLGGGSSKATKGGGVVGSKVMPDFPINEVAKIKIVSGSVEFLLERTEEKGWVVPSKSGYAADFEKVSGLLRRVWETKVVQGVSAGQSGLVRLELAKPTPGTAVEGSGLLLEFLKADGSIAGSLVLGKETAPPNPQGGMMMGGTSGRFVLNPAKPDQAVVVAETFSEAVIDGKAWLDDAFISVAKPKRIEVTSPEANKSWIVERPGETDSFNLAALGKGDETDSTKIVSLQTLLSFPRFEDVLPVSTPNEVTGFDKPTRVVINTFDKFVYNVEIGKADDKSNRHVRVTVSAEIPESRVAAPDEKEEDKKRLDEEFTTKQKELKEKLAKEAKVGEWIYLLPESQLTAVLAERASFLKAPEPAAAPAPSSSPTPKAKR